MFVINLFLSKSKEESKEGASCKEKSKKPRRKSLFERFRHKTANYLEPVAPNQNVNKTSSNNSPIMDTDFATLKEGYDKGDRIRRSMSKTSINRMPRNSSGVSLYDSNQTITDKKEKLPLGHPRSPSVRMRKTTPAIRSANELAQDKEFADMVSNHETKSHGGILLRAPSKGNPCLRNDNGTFSMDGVYKEWKDHRRAQSYSSLRIHSPTSHSSPALNQRRLRDSRSRSQTRICSESRKSAKSDYSI